MNNEQMQPLLDKWYRDRDEAPRDANGGLAWVMARVPQTQQRGRRWPFGRVARAPIPPTNGPTPEREFTMFSAVKFVVAGAIVALFGGFLLAGVLTTPQGDELAPAAVSASPEPEATTVPTEPTLPPDPSARTDLLPGVTLAVEEVEPDVFKVLNDGVRDLHSGRQTDIAAGHDDGIWLLRKNRFFRLGTEAAHAWPKEGGPYHGDFEVAPDGTVWVIKSLEPPDIARRGPLFSSDGDGWTRTRSLSDEIFDIAVAPDGTLWVSWWDEGAEIRYLGPSGWQPLDVPRLAAGLYPVDSGVLYATECGWGICEGHRYEDGASTGFGWLSAFDVAPDGTVWLLTAEEGHVSRSAGDAWVSWTPEELPDMGLGIALEGLPGRETFTSTFMAAPDGSMWASLWQRGPDGDEPPARGLWTLDQRKAVDRYDPQCDGLVRFDGETADRFLPGRCLTMDIAVDGSVWVLADEGKGKDLYVITPEAVAGAE